ncbi:AraC family transcriptional regulator [Mycobacterium sp. ITM-2016-00317]|uniref:helix-turn-helix transcriptional regulator n=1 Tax=Mycobacterium sp. ITM-2016-00317 TaxID=2099694 RepID=UPI00287F50A9|nr:AraC family transcriptional regulator [Mycobacterium sp. ITM-2016-00317]WNG87193.1 AraC family transcriptional regulator [Mycobacterium sp. ITM-2016-00317]
MGEMSRFAGRRDGVPIYAYPSEPGAPPVSLVRFERTSPVPLGRHIHDFPVLVHHGASGAVDVVAAGATVDPALVGEGEDAVALFFDPAALGGSARAPWPAWRAHPVLFPFLHSEHNAVLRLTVPAHRRAFWDSTVDAIDSELTERRDGYRQAALAHLTVLLIELARMADDVVGDLKRDGEPLLAKVFEVIDEHIDQQVSLRDVARECGMTPGHLTTVVRRRTGRTVGDWITERRMVEARSLLAGTDLGVQEISRRVGIADPGYFTRVFRRAHGEAPRRWRARHTGVRTG